MERWDSGAVGCGTLAAELQRRVGALEPGELLEVVARDPGAQVDIPAWCRLTGHDLVEATPPRFVIRRR